MNRRKSLIISLIAYLVALGVGYLIVNLLGNQMDILYSTLIANVIATTIIFIGSLIINNSSLYDPYWSVIPIFIVLLWVLEYDSANTLYWVMFIGVLIWGLRLTLNWMTDFKGYSHEDFRYVDFRNKFGKLYWIISYLGIHLFPTLIVYVSLYPIYYLLNNTISTPMFIYIGVLVMVVGAVISYIADLQLRTHKLKGNKNSIMTGLWSVSRHPNYFGEVTFWLGVALTSLSVGFNVLPFLGFIGMLLLFNLYSVPKMEDKLLKNKPDYQVVIDNVPRFFINLISSKKNQEEINN